MKRLALENGIQVLLEYRPNDLTTRVMLGVKNDSNYDAPEKSGLASPEATYIFLLLCARKKTCGKRARNNKSWYKNTE